MPTDSVASNDTLVSIICRSLGRPFLSQALSSLADQTHSNLEVLLVNTNGEDHAAFIQAHPTLNIKELTASEQLPRSEAANTGMAAATGDYFLFLDDDDWIGSEHIATLLSALRENPDVKAAYSCTQKTEEDGTLLDEVFRQDYDAALLLRDNYIPIHSVLFERSLYDQGCRFDTEFEIFEDWDFWLQASQHTDFKFIDVVGAYYRGGGDSETRQEDISVRYQQDHVLGKARAKLFDKWLEKWSGSDLNRLLGSMDQAPLISSLQDEVRSRDDKLNAEHQTNLEHQQQISELLNESATLRDRTDNLEHSLKHAEHHITAIEQQNSSLQDDLGHLHEIQRQITNSISWKITAPFRWIRRSLSGGKQVAPKQPSDSNE
ncbi:MAG: glycosyltransferase [Pseudomonadales bacterium]|nr:glycosyltransferase [Pseudomonadales bacterium]